MDEAEMRATIIAALRTLDAQTEKAIRDELAAPIDLGDGGRIQFEIDPFTFGIQLIQTENDVLQDDTLYDAFPETFLDDAEADGLDFFPAIADSAIPWLADRWTAAGGPEKYRPAYAFFHGPLDRPWYDLEQRRWVDVPEVWPIKP